jgi:hypothetical protein
METMAAWKGMPDNEHWATKEEHVGISEQRESAGATYKEATCEVGQSAGRHEASGDRILAVHANEADCNSMDKDWEEAFREEVRDEAESKGPVWGVRWRGKPLREIPRGTKCAFHVSGTTEAPVYGTSPPIFEMKEDRTVRWLAKLEVHMLGTHMDMDEFGEWRVGQLHNMVPGDKGYGRHISELRVYERLSPQDKGASVEEVFGNDYGVCYVETTDLHLHSGQNVPRPPIYIQLVKSTKPGVLLEGRHTLATTGQTGKPVPFRGGMQQADKEMKTDEDEWDEAVNRKLKMPRSEEEEDDEMQEDAEVAQGLQANAGEAQAHAASSERGHNHTAPVRSHQMDQSSTAWRTGATGTAARLFPTQEEGDWSSTLEKRLKKPMSVDPSDAVGKPCVAGSILSLTDMIGVIGSEEWLGLFQVCGGGDGNERVTLHPKDWREWIRLMREYLDEGMRTIRELAAALRITLSLHVDGHLKAGRTGGKGWCGWLALLQAMYANDGYEYDMACCMAEEGMQGLDGRLRNMLMRARTTGSGAKINELMGRIKIPLPNVEKELWFQTDDDINASAIGQVAWYMDTGRAFSLLHTSFETREGGMIYTDIPTVLLSAAVGCSNDHFFLAAVPVNIKKQQLEERFCAYVTDTVRRLKELRKVAIPREVVDYMRKKEMEAISMKAITTPEFVLILNIPYEVRLIREHVRDHVRVAAANQPYVMLKKTCGDTEASMRAVESLSAGDSYGVIVECKKTRQFGDKTVPEHFAVTTNMENEVNTRVYWCQLVTAEQAQTLTARSRALVAIFRGCAKHDTIDDMMLRAVKHYLEMRKVGGCTAVVEQLYHWVEGQGGVREMVIAVYTPTGDNLSVLRKALGFDRGKNEIKADVRGLIFQVVPDATYMKGKQIPEWGIMRKVHATLANVDPETSDQTISNTLVEAFGVNNVDYWATKQTIRGVSIIIGLTHGFEASRVDPFPLRGILMAAEERLVLEFDKSLLRRDVGQYAKASRAVPSSGASTSTSSWSRSSGRSSGSEGGRGRQGRTNVAQR